MVSSVGEVIVSREKTESDLLKEKDEQIQNLTNTVERLTLFHKEMNHRIKNQLSTIITLLRLQKRYTDDSNLNNFLNDCESRVMSIALVHEHLYKMNHDNSGSCKLYIDRILKEMHNIYQLSDRKIVIATNVDDIHLSSAYMMPCGLVITELLTNCFKYAFPKSWQGDPEIEISVFKENEMCCIKVCDNGVGFDCSESDSDSQSLGIQIVTMLVEHQLNGEIFINSSNGTCINIRFKAQ